MTTQQPIIELEQISRTFGDFQALTDITMQVFSGRIGLLGQNGAGKSTLMKIMLGLLSPTSGRGLVLGRALLPNSRDEGDLELRRMIGYMPEADSLIPGLKGIEYVCLAAEMYGLSRKESLRRAHEVLYYLQLDEARYRRLEEYSTGMKQRLKLAQALVHDPQLLFLDEPTSGLDPAGRSAMLRLLNELGSEHGKSIILSTHLLGDVEAVCEQVIILANGKVRGKGNVRELVEKRQHRMRLRVQGDSDDFQLKLRNHGVIIQGQTTTGELRLELPENWEPAKLFQLATASGCVVRKWVPDEETMNELFFRSIEEQPVHS